MSTRLLAAGLTLLVCLPGCLLFAGRNWEQTRRTVIDPINTSLHRHLAKDVTAKDLDRVLGAYAPQAREAARERYARLFDTFGEIDRTDYRIHRVRWREPDPGKGYPAETRMIVRGVTADGQRTALDRRSRVWVDAPEGRWVITDEVRESDEWATAPRPAFEVATEAAGIGDVHDTSGAPIFRLLEGVTISSGSAVGDVDCDGLEDLLLVSGSHVGVYLNRGDATFRPASAELGLDVGIDTWATGIALFDADNDGDPDLFLSGIEGDRFYRNDHCSRFVDATAESGIAPARWSSMPLVADYDRDGFLDVYVVRMGDHMENIPKPNWDARNGVRDTLYRNRGDGTFEDVTDAAGIQGRTWGLAGAWADYDDDGYPDLYVGNEYGTNELYHNWGDGTFEEVAEKAGAQDRGAAMGVAWGDYDRDGDPDLFVSNMYSNSRWALVHPDFPPPVPWYFSWVPRAQVDEITDELTRGSTLLRNDGDGTFTDVSETAGMRDCQWGWAAEFFDYDNDGWLDVYGANGFVSGPKTDDV